MTLVGDKPWIRLKAVGTGDWPFESWFSFPRNTAAQHKGDYYRFDDFRTDVRYEYNAHNKKLFRLTTSDEKSFQSLGEFFQAIFRGDSEVGDRLAEVPIVKQSKQTVEENGKEYVLYELELQRGDLADTATAVIRVPADTLLPEKLMITHGKDKMEFAIDYPEDGPHDIYSLGVSRDAPLDDRTPPADVRRILQTVERNRSGFGDYTAVSSHGIMVRVVRCKGEKWRVDVCVTEDLGSATAISSAGDLEKLWRNRPKNAEMSGVLLCDGRQVFRQNIGNTAGPEKSSGWKAERRAGVDGGRGVGASFGDSARALIELVAFPPGLCSQLTSVPVHTVSFDPRGENGPAGSVRLDVRFDKPRAAGVSDSAYHRRQYWLEPKYGYAVVRDMCSDGPTVKKEDGTEESQSNVYEYGGYQQSPRGVWYPTKVCRKNAGHRDNKDNPGGVECFDETTYFYVDFGTDLPDELFQTDKN